SSSTAGSSPPLSWWVYDLEPGTHTLYVRYEGSASQPPSTSNIVTLNIRKAHSITSIGFGTYQVDQYKTLKLRVELTSGTNGGAPSGWVRMYDGDQFVTGAYASNFGQQGATHFDMTIPAWLQPGTHHLHAVYEGDKDFEGSTS